MKTEYSRADYDLDRKYVQLHDSLQNPNEINKLEALMQGPGQKTLFVNLPEVSLRFLAMETAYDVLDKPGTATSIVSNRARRAKLNLNPGGLAQLVDELTASIHKHVNELFDQRYRGALVRIGKYEREHPEVTRPPKKPEPKPEEKPVKMDLFPNLHTRFEC